MPSMAMFHTRRGWVVSKAGSVAGVEVCFVRPPVSATIRPIFPAADLVGTMAAALEFSAVVLVVEASAAALSGAVVDLEADFMVEVVEVAEAIARPTFYPGKVF